MICFTQKSLNPLKSIVRLVWGRFAFPIVQRVLREKKCLEL